MRIIEAPFMIFLGTFEQVYLHFDAYNKKNFEEDWNFIFNCDFTCW